MALFKNYVVPGTGETVNWWELVSISYDAKSDSSEVVYAGWANHTAWSNKLAPAATLSWKVTSAAAPALASSVKAFAQGVAQASAELHGATIPPGS